MIIFHTKVKYVIFTLCLSVRKNISVLYRYLVSLFIWTLFILCFCESLSLKFAMEYFLFVFSFRIPFITVLSPVFLILFAVLFLHRMFTCVVTGSLKWQKYFRHYTVVLFFSSIVDWMVYFHN